MTWFTLPEMRSDTPPAFLTLDGCNEWLAAQPLANAPLMQELLATQLNLLNVSPLPARERYKILETLRKPAFAIETEAIKRYESRPLPLSAIEHKAFTGSCRLWRSLATGYLHCLRASLDKDESLADRYAKVVHRVLTCLRLEQMSRYRASATIPAEWWQLLHATLASADDLAVTTTPVTDRLFAETRESTPSGQYAMALLLHLARPHELSRSQLSAVVRWFARWREQARIYPSLAAAGDRRTVVIDLRSDLPIHASRGAPENGRWLDIDAILGKCKNRLKDIKEGKSPESLHLGNLLPTEACVGLLQFLHGALQSPPAPAPDASEALAEVRAATTLERVHLLLGGKPVNAPPAPTVQSNRTAHEQIAIFGHVVREETPSADEGLEAWQLLLDQNGLLILHRAAETAGERLGHRSLIAIRMPAGEIRLLVLRSLALQEDGSLLAWAKALPAGTLALQACGRERMTNRIILHPAIFVPGAGRTGAPPSLLVPAGAMAKLMRLDVSELPDGLKPGAIIDRGSNYERLACQ